jgi:precorrin-6A/cobalt-precorrin-6A reductase
VVDATHPFAARMSANAVAATQETGVPLVAFTRPAWQAGPTAGSMWPIWTVRRRAGRAGATVAAGAGPAACAVLPPAAAPLCAALRRSARGAAALPRHTLVVDRGPFTLDGDLALLRDHAVDLVVCKNAGGSAAQAKLIAARALRLPVIMIDRPFIPRHEVHDAQAVLDWIAHAPAPSPLAERCGV